ncbi:MAG TPA: terminase, partial [Gammaproteobacteria bacterium]|nr:terminase [Gammaproteobacteria bacterium]
MQLDLHPRQGDAYLTDATELLYGGAAGGGKSHLFRVASIAWCYDIPGLQVYLFRREFPDLYKNHVEGPSGYPAMLARYIEAGKVRPNWSKNQIGFWNGSKIHLCHCKNEKDVYGYQGAEIHVLMIDELTQWLATMYRYLRGRVRLGGLNIPKHYQDLFPRILNGANPGGIGHNWVKADFIDIGPPESKHRMPKKEGGMLRQYIPAKLEDNPTLVENDPDYEYRLEGLGSAELVRAMRMGDWDIVAGGMFDDVWNRDKHVIDPFPIPSSWRIDRSFDWGSSKPFSVGWWAESDGSPVIWPDQTETHYPRGTLFRIAEWYGWNG